MEFGKVMYTLLHLKRITNKVLACAIQDLLYVAHGTLLNVMFQLGWENGYIHVYGWVPSLFTWNYHIGDTPIQNKSLKFGGENRKWLTLARTGKNAENWKPYTLTCRGVTVKVAQLCSPLCDPMDSTDSPWNSPGQNTGVGSLSLLQGIFPTQGSNPGLLPCRQILYQLSHRA